MGVSKKHHYVPQFLLRHFSDPSEQLQVHRILDDIDYRSAVGNLGHRNNGHTLYWPNRPANPDILEHRMADLEGHTASVVAAVRHSRSNTVNDEWKLDLAWFLALQWRRHRFLLDLVRDAALDGYEDASGAHKSIGLVSMLGTLEAWSLRNDASVRPKERWDSVASTLTYDFNWRIVRYRGPSLIVSDNTVCLSGARAGHQLEVPPAWTDHGIGIGFDTCARVTVALTPECGLLLQRDGPVKHIRAELMNRWTILNSREFVAHSLNWPTQSPRLYRTAMADLRTQRFIFPRLLLPSISVV